MTDKLNTNRIKIVRKKYTAQFKDQVMERIARDGVPQVSKIQGLKVGLHRISSIMKKNGWRAKAAKKYKATTNSNHKLPVAPNLLEQNFSAIKPNEKWAVTSLTFGQKKDGFTRDAS